MTKVDINIRINEEIQEWLTEVYKALQEARAYVEVIKESYDHRPDDMPAFRLPGLIESLKEISKNANGPPINLEDLIQLIFVSYKE